MNNRGRSLLFILVFSILAFLVALPRVVPIDINIGPLKVNESLEKNPLSLEFGNIKIFRDFELKLGLDLVGGSHFVYEAKTDGLNETEKERALSGLEEVISQRINLFGVSEANVQRANFEGKDRIIVELPGVTSPEEAKELIGRTAQLVFVEFVGEGENLELKPTELTGAELEFAEVTFDTTNGKPVVQIDFNDEGSKKFEEITERNVGKPLGMALDNQFISEPPIVQEKISGGSAVISGQYTIEEARNLAIQLNAGALPVEISLIEEQTIGPSLGKESIEKSVKAGIVGVVAVMIFMIIIYRRLGLIANIGLILFGIYTIALYKLVPVVLTLPGIAGFLLSVGMAVDANILVFERFREERAKGVSVAFGLETAFGRAWDSIRDANIATLMTAFVLANPFNWQFLHTSGAVRGFAVTLALGILISLFTGVFVSRNLLRMFLIRNKNE